MRDERTDAPLHHDALLPLDHLFCRLPAGAPLYRWWSDILTVVKTLRYLKD